MDTRRLQTIGGGASFAVSLPKQWVEARGLHAGDEIAIEARGDGELVLRGTTTNGKDSPQRLLTIRSSDADEVLRSLIALYVSGFSTAAVDHSGSDPQAVRTGVGEACARLQGVQIVEEGSGRLILQDLSDTSGFDLDKGLRRAQILALQMVNNVGRILAGGGDSVYRETERYEAELDRLVLLLLKQYTTCLQRWEFPPSIGTSPPEGLHALFVAHYLERIGDYAMRASSFSQFLLQQPSSAVTETVQESLTELHGIVADAVKAFNARDAKLANSVIKRSAAFAPTSGRDRMFDVFTAPRSQPQLYSCHRCIKYFTLLESIERIALYAKSIAEAAINRSMLEPEKHA
ncbi:MAG: hypothetical protein HYU26_10195 [Candidatus Rokubacteria bacterium]|nr:hypothetical protein [Candidatus Rokubacteria bacterium]